MKHKILTVALFVFCVGLINAQNDGSFYNFKMKDIKGNVVALSEYKNKVVLVVNTASKCGLTPQYEGLEALYQKYKSRGFVILGFPCNQFLGQEPGTAEEIQNFCSSKYNITFPLFDKILVNGKQTNPLYQYLKSKQTLDGNNDIRWNFEKFLIDKNGIPVKRFSPKTKPAELVADIESLLNQ